MSLTYHIVVHVCHRDVDHPVLTGIMIILCKDIVEDTWSIQMKSNVTFQIKSHVPLLAFRAIKQVNTNNGLEIIEICINYNDAKFSWD